MWPLFELRIRHRDVLLRPVREADLPHLCAVPPSGVGAGPGAADFPAPRASESVFRLVRRTLR